MAVNDVFELTLYSGSSGQIMVQSFFYKHILATAGNAASTLRQYFRNDVVPSIAGITMSANQISRIVVKNLFTPTDWEDYAISPVVTGTRTGALAPTFAAVSLKSSKPTAAQQPARKRFGYVSEDDITGVFVITGGTFETALNALAIDLGATLGLGGADEFQPVICKRVKYVTPNGNTAYRLPANAGEATTYPAVNWSFEPKITSQVSRKSGRGI